jgi:hypothetical protein
VSTFEAISVIWLILNPVAVKVRFHRFSLLLFFLALKVPYRMSGFE